MLLEPRRFIDEGNRHETSSVVSYQRNTHFGSTVHHTSSMVVNVRQLQVELQEQHQHEKDELNELNQRFHLFIDRIQSLQLQNSKYLAAITDIRRQSSGVSTTTEEEESYFSSRASYSSAYSGRIDYEWNFELYQLQVSIYQRLIDLEQQSKGKRISMLEEELKQAVVALMDLRAAYEQRQRVVENLYAENGDLTKQYLSLTHDWCNMKKQRRKWDLSMETLKSYIGFYKNLRSNVMSESKSLLISADEMNQFWILELERIVTRIRRDFEIFYGAIYEQMTVYYGTKTEELETNIRQARQYEQVEYEKFSVVQQKLKIEYEKVQTTLSYEKEILIKLEGTYSKLEAEYKSIQLQYEEQLEVQSNELQIVQEGIVALAYDVDEIRRSKANLEVELIIYRQLLEAGGVATPMTVIPRPQPVIPRPQSVIPRTQLVIPHPQPVIENETTGKLVLKRLRKGPIAINQCTPDGTYISLVNHSSSRTIDISKWMLARNLDTGSKFRYVIPDGTRLEPGRELRIYARNTGGGSDSNGRIVYQKLINNDLVSWGDANTIETFLFNQNGGEEASYSQSLAARRI